uniref:G-protein coupled receptors family 2 profile 2 domain-containing protein n=1 Tax=Panagrolaimus sp. ES5 TaxID=591445 RepID=A0AC34GRP6_9BILA
MWKSLSFFALVKNNSLGIKTGVIEKPASTTTEKKQSNHGFLWSWLASTSDNSAPQSSTPNQPLTFDTADACSSGVYFKNSYSSNAGGVDANGIPSATGSTVWVKRRSDGNPTEPLVCSSGAKTTQAVIGGIGIFIAVIGIFGYFFKSKTIPIISTIASVVFNIFNDKNLPKRLKFFAYCYNATFLLYSLYLLLFAEQQITNTSKGMCTAFAVVGYILYISAVFLSVIMIIITLEALGCWKPMIRKGLYIFTGNQKIYVPFIYSYGIPLLLTAIFAAALTSFFKRNDGYCWIRPDYAFLALWFPIILLLFTIPLYIILIARRWPNASISKRIYSPLTISDDLTDYEASKKKRKAREKAENKKDKKNNEDSIERGGVDDIDGGDEADDGKVVLTNQTLARLIIPQIFLAIPLIAENLALYYAKLTGWHYLFFLTQAFQLIALHGISYIDKISYVRTGWNWIKGKFMKKSPKKTENDEEVAVVEKPKKPPRGQKRQNTLPNDIEDFEPVTLARDSEIQKPRTEMLRMTRRPNEDSEDDGNGNEVITRESELSGEEEEESKTSSISIESLTPKTNKLKDDAIISKDEQRHAGAHDLGDDIASTISLKSYTPEAALETEIPVKVHILRLDSNMLPDVPFIREPVDEWLQDHNEKGLQTQPGGDWHHLDEHGIQLRFSDIPSGSRSSHSSSNHSHEKEELSESDSDGEEKLVEEVVSNPNLASQTYSDDATQIIDSLPDIEQISKDNHIPSSYIPYIGEAVSDDSSLEEEMVKQVLHPNLQPQIHQDDATMIIDSLPPVEEISNFEPDYSEMYHLDKNPVHSLSPSDHIPLDIPFIRESIDTALAQGKTPSYIPLDPRRPSIISVHQDEIVEKVKEAPSSGLPPDKGILPESQQLPTYEINMDDLYTFDRHGLHYLSPSEGELPVDCPFIRNPVEEDLQRSRAPSYIPRLFGHQHDETTEILVYQKQMEEIELSQNIHQHHHHHDETEKHVHHHHHGEHESLKMEPTKMVVHEQQSIGKGSDLSGYPEVIRNILGHHHHHHQHDETTEILVYQKQMEEIELPKQNFSPQIFYSQHSIGATSEASTSIYQTPPETPLANLSPLHYRMPSDNVSMATQYYQTPPETPFQAYQMSHQHPLSTHDIHHHHHHRRGSSGSESEFPFFKFKTLRNEDLVGPENVIHSDSTSLAEED